MASTASDQDAQDVKGLVDGLLLASSSMRRKLIGRLDARLERSPLLNHHDGHDAEGALVLAARDVHPDLEPVARQLGRLLALGPHALSAGQLRLLAQAGFQRTASRVGGLHARQTNAADLLTTVRQHPIAAVLAAMTAGYIFGRAVR